MNRIPLLPTALLMLALCQACTHPPSANETSLQSATPEYSTIATPTIDRECPLRDPADPPWVCRIPSFSAPAPFLSPTPPPTTTPTPSPGQIILFQYGLFGGDGGNAEDFYLGRDTPWFVLYSDGTLITTTFGSHEAQVFWQSHLTAPQICSIRTRLIHSGFFLLPTQALSDEENPYYDFAKTRPFGDGGSHIFIQANGQPAQQIWIYYFNYPYIIPSLKEADRIFSQYHPADPHPYEPQTALLWLELTPEDAPPDRQVQPWPSTLPRLAHLMDMRVEYIYLYRAYHVVLSAPLAGRILQLVRHTMASYYFSEGGREYHIIVRPLLPHETPDRFSPYPLESSEFPFPYDCDRQVHGPA